MANPREIDRIRDATARIEVSAVRGGIDWQCGVPVGLRTLTLTA
jgi:hypothetical protein